MTIVSGAIMTVASRNRISPLAIPRETENLLGDDVPLDLRGAGVDGAGPGVQRDLPPGVTRHRVTAGVVGAGCPAWPLATGDQPGQALDVEGELGDLAVVLAPVQLADRGGRAHLLAVEHVGEDAVPDEAHHLDAGERLAETLADHRVLDRAGLPGKLGQPVGAR